jgi:transposase
MQPVCCGLDVHRMKISACVITIDSDGNEHSEIKEFGAFTDDLISLRSRVITNNCPIIAMEVVAEEFKCQVILE